MKPLAELQNAFQDFILQPGSQSTAWVSKSGRVSPDTQLSVYAHAYVSRLREVIENDYPAINMAVGDADFTLLAEDYIQKYPSHYFSLREFGRYFPNYIAEKIQQDTKYREMGWLYELARFEWTLGQAFDAADSPLVSEREMADIPADDWPLLRFTFHPSLHCLDFTWNTPKVWKALTADQPEQINAIQTPSSPWLVWRQDLVTRFRSLPTDEHLALNVLRQGGAFNDACEHLASQMSEDEVPMRAAVLLKGWVHQGLIVGIG